MVEHAALADDRVHEVGVAVELVLNDVVEDFQQEEDEVVVGGARVQEPRSAERLNDRKMDLFQIFLVLGKLKQDLTSSKWSSFVLETMESVFTYGDTVSGEGKKIINKQYP